MFGVVVLCFPAVYLTGGLDVNKGKLRASRGLSEIERERRSRRAPVTLIRATDIAIVIVIGFVARRLDRSGFGTGGACDSGEAASLVG